MKILSRKNGIALVAVLAVLLVLTLLLPVMFRSSESAMRSAGTELSRQKAGYLARTGAEMAVASVKSTLGDAKKDPESTYGKFYEALKNESLVANDTYGIKVVDGQLQATLAPITLFQKKDDATGKIDSKYLSGYNVATPSGYERIGTAEITVAYNGKPEYYKVDEKTNTYEKVTGDTQEDIEKQVFYEETLYEAGEKGPEAVKAKEINHGYVAIYNDNYIVKSTATVNGQTKTRTAIVVETLNMYDEENPEEGYIAYTEQYMSKAPQFVRMIKGDYPKAYNYDKKKKDWVEVTEKPYEFGGNQAFANPFKATSKKEVKAFGEGLNGVKVDENDYYSKDVYIFSAIGNMHINVPENRKIVTAVDHPDDSDRGGNTLNPLVFGAYPGINWRVFENTTSGMYTSLQGMNYNDHATDAQRYNFMSFCATDTLQVSLPVELRVNPKRAGRTGDGPDTNCTLFKVLNFQAKDIVFDKKIDLFASICNEEFIYLGMGIKREPQDKAYRGGFLNLTAPANTPYSYYNSGRKKTVPAGIVYFTEPVYLWFQEYNALGRDDAAPNSYNYGSGGTMYRLPVINSNTEFKEAFSGSGIMQVTNYGESLDLVCYKLFEAGDVYYFNADITQKYQGEDMNVGVNLVNWFLETKYFKAKDESSTIWDLLFDFKQTLYFNLVNNAIAENGKYYEDDMHFIGNMNDDPTLIPPSVENELYVIWDN